MIYIHNIGFLLHNIGINAMIKFRFMKGEFDIKMNKDNAPLFHGDIVEGCRILYTASSFAKGSLIYLQEIGYLKARKPHVSSRPYLPSYLFFIVLSGSGTLDYQGETYRLSLGDCVFIDCTKPYAHNTSDDLWQLAWIHFNGPTMPGIYAKYQERGGLPVFHPRQKENFDTLYTSLNGIYETANTSDHIRDMKINDGLAKILSLIMAESWHPDMQRNDTKKQNIIQVRSYLDEHFAESISLATLAEMIYINKYYLVKAFKQQFGLTISQYIQQKRITHAKHLLRFTNRSIESIGIECGIEQPHYFSRIFKKIEGISPSQYRAMWQTQK